MIEDIKRLFETQGGEFISSPSFIYEKLKGIKAYIFDWDGVFNNGSKSENSGSGFSEPDSMGLNLLRFGFWMSNNKQFPYVSIITGEVNQTAIKLAERENFHHIYFNFKNKALAFDHFLKTFNLMPAEVAFCFDDILDIPVAKQCGLRFLIRRSGSPLFLDYLKEMSLCDYISGPPGGQHALREVAELILGFLGQYKQALIERTDFSPLYMNYLDQRKKIEFRQFRFADNQIK